ncbi:hypothetical protein GCM10023156_13060 [Novipirellula rosea]|uniref:Oxidoreductase n=1 Tax=Novipirellula rosea TaxID=1031540 RepID=A0ABP8MGH6_9BACT
MANPIYLLRPIGWYAGILQLSLRTFANCVPSGETPTPMTLGESRAVVAWIAAATESAQSGSVIMF